MNQNSKFDVVVIGGGQSALTVCMRPNCRLTNGSFSMFNR